MNAAFQNLNTVETAARWATALLSSEQAITTDEAAARLARRVRTTPTFLRCLLQPSRQPKGVEAGVFLRLRAAYVAYLERQVSAIERELTLLSADPVTGAREADRVAGLVAHLAREAERLKAIAAGR